ncbi:hypothetical protein [Embleya sp. AB8]|uniref:hypothetical protein n=1 Tax=Embleya sp. AB8 TaxID=3156304 RepID=UPI003C782F9D
MRSVAFMELRGQRGDGGAGFEAAREAEPATGEVEVEWVLESLYQDGNFTHAVALKLPDVRLETLDGGTVWRLWDRGDRGRSWALVDDRPRVGRAVQGGPRRLWDEVAAALEWQDEHRVHGYDFGITVEPDRQWAWAERPDRRRRCSPRGRANHDGSRARRGGGWACRGEGAPVAAPNRAMPRLGVGAGGTCLMGACRRWAQGRQSTAPRIELRMIDSGR